MINHGIIILENGKWKAIDFQSELTKFNSHEEFAKQYITNNENINKLFQEYMKEYEKNCNRNNENYNVDAVEFLMQYFGFVKIGLRIQGTSHTIIFYRQSPEFDESKIGKDRLSIINTYRARGFVEDPTLNIELPDFVYEMQRDNQFLKSLYCPEQESLR